MVDITDQRLNRNTHQITECGPHKIEQFIGYPGILISIFIAKSHFHQAVIGRIPKNFSFFHFLSIKSLVISRQETLNDRMIGIKRLDDHLTPFLLSSGTSADLSEHMERIFSRPEIWK